jgi:hypothetical protein
MAKAAAKRRMDDVTMEGVQIRIRNFTGKEGTYNVKGQRNFLVLLNDDVADAMLEDGWNVKYLKPRDEDERPQPFLKVKVNFDSEPKPRVVLVTTRNKTTLSEEDAYILDWADIVSSDLIINPYQWTRDDGRSGITAYLRAGYFTINENELDLKYADVPENQVDSAQANAGSVHFVDSDDL